MAILKRREQPEPWSRHRERAKYRWLAPFIAIEWVWAWLAYWLSGWAFLEVLEYLGTLSVLLAEVSYFSPLRCFVWVVLRLGDDWDS